MKFKSLLASVLVKRICITMKQKPSLIFLIGLILGGGIIYLTSLSKNKAIQTASSETNITKIKPEMVTEDFDFWKLECEENQKNCKISQTLSFNQKLPDDTSRTILALNLMLYIVKDKDGKKLTRIRFITPLGLDLMSGLALRVDEGKEHKIPIQICHADGCLADFNLGDDVLLEMKKGKDILVGYKLSNTNTNPIILKISLKGITAAYDSLLETAN